MPAGHPKPRPGGAPLGALYCALALDDGWLCQPKLDGVRAQWRAGRLWSHEGRPLAGPLATLRRVAPGRWLDGELFAGRYVVFDEPGREAPFGARFAGLAGLDGEGVEVCRALDARQVTWADIAVRFEGVVFKRLCGWYPHNQRVTSEWVKFRAAWGCAPLEVR